MEEFREIGDYLVLRKIGEGAFGRVYLVENKAPEKAGFYALKLIDKTLKNRELKAFEKFKNLPPNKNIIEILDSGFVRDNFYYIMPLADSLEGEISFPIGDFRWQEKSLYKEIIRRLENPLIPYFSVEEILKIVADIFDGVIALSENAFVHRDIKPENILFIKGVATLSDFGLLEFDKKSISRVGTPLYFAPSWYVNKGGNPDVYGVAMSFYTLITGNLPDTIGRVSYRFPEKLKANISKDLEAQYLHWHRCILRAVAENPADRYVQISDFKEAILSKNFETSLVYKGDAFEGEKDTKKLRNFFAICLIFAVVIFIFYLRHNSAPMQSIDEFKTEGISNVLYEEIAKNGFKKDTYSILSKAEWTKQKQEILDSLKEDLVQAEKLEIENKSKPIINSKNINQVNLSNIDSFQMPINKINAIKEAIVITQNYIKDDSGYKEYLSREYFKINSILNDL